MLTDAQVRAAKSDTLRKLVDTRGCTCTSCRTAGGTGVSIPCPVKQVSGKTFEDVARDWHGHRPG